MVAMFSYSGGDSESGSVGDPSMSVIRPMSAYQSRLVSSVKLFKSFKQAYMRTFVSLFYFMYVHVQGYKYMFPSYCDYFINTVIVYFNQYCRYRFTLLEDANYTHSIQIAIEYPEYESLRLNNRPLANSIHWTTVPGKAWAILVMRFEVILQESGVNVINVCSF